MMPLETAPIASQKQSILGRVTAVFVYLFEKVMPDPFVFAVLLTFVGALLALRFAPNATPVSVLAAWYAGVFGLFTFAFQMVIMLVAGYALATSPVVHRGLAKLASFATTPLSAISLTIVVSMIASWLNWGLGLVTAALIAREIAKRVRMDFGWLVAAAYTGFVISTEGLSGSIALSQATHGSALNIVEKITGQSLPLTQTVFTRFNLIPIAVLFLVLPVVFRFLAPTEANTIAADPDRLRAEDAYKPMAEKADNTVAARLDNAWILNVLLALFGLCAIFFELRRNRWSVDLNSVIMTLLMAGLLLHWRPAAYIAAIKNAARITGPLILQYPLYGGLMGIITTTGLAAVLSKIFISFSTSHTLPFFTYLTSLVITLFVPSGGGHWAVQGPFAIPAARDLHASYAGTTMAVAMGESVANMLQPFFALPILAIAGIKMRRMMGFMVVTFLISFVVFGASLLLLVPAP
ncbi:MAG: TIGR00366 family protein [Acidobacteriota bacterium]|nr:TIGR00366 family protein [Acidobacteriota bacterium]